MYALVSDDRHKSYIAEFASCKYDRLREKYAAKGSTLTPINHVPVPAAAPIQQPLPKQDADRATMPKHRAIVKVEKSIPAVTAKPAKPLIVDPDNYKIVGENGKRITRKTLIPYAAKFKAVVNETTGEFFNSGTEVVKEYGIAASLLSRILNGKKKSRTYRGLRWATAAEIKLKKVLPTKSNQYANPV